MRKDSKTWMVRAGQGGFLIDEFLEKNIVAIGWNEIGYMKVNLTFSSLKQQFRKIYPDDSAGRVGQSVGQLWQIFKKLKVGDNVVTYDPDRRVYYIGTIISDYSYNQKFTYSHYREVRWEKEPVPRDSLSVEARNSLGSIRTIFNISQEVTTELLESLPTPLRPEKTEKLTATSKIAKEEDIVTEELAEDIVSRSVEFIKDMISKLEWFEMEKFVAGIFRALGYKTRTTGFGGDLGSDILASLDGLGMVEPRIKIEVKHQVKSKNKVGADQIRNFLGGLRTEKGIYISTTGFTKEAQYEAQRANFSMTLIDSDLLVELLLENYERMDPDIKAMVPLRKIYWPS